MYLPINPEFPVGNAAGWCKSVTQAQHLLEGTASFIVMGSFTLKQRDGNPGNTSNGDDRYMLNSLGLPNPGIEALLQSEDLTGLFQRAEEQDVPIILSVAGFNPAEYHTLVRQAVDTGFPGVEINLGCPNVVEGSERKPIASFDPPLVRQILFGVAKLMQRHFISVKVSPMTNPLDILDLAKVLGEFPHLGAVVTQNTYPNCLLLNEDGTPQIQTPDQTGWAGGSGSSIFSQALGQVSQWHRALPDVPIWGVGGVSSGRQVRDMLRAGGRAVQIGTAWFNTGGSNRFFGPLASEFANL